MKLYENYKIRLEKFNSLTNNEIISITNGNKAFKINKDDTGFNNLKQELKIFLDDIAKNGDNDINWLAVRNLIIIYTKEMLMEFYQ